MKTLANVGTAWGEEGKAKITDFLSENCDIITRFKKTEKTYADLLKEKVSFFKPFFLNEQNTKVLNIIPNGVFIEPKSLYVKLQELQSENIKYNLKISSKAHIIMPYHLILEEEHNLNREEEITKPLKGRYTAYFDKINKIGIRMGTFTSEYFFQDLKEKIENKNKIRGKQNKPLLDFNKIYEEYKVYSDFLKPYVCDTSFYLSEAIKNNKRILFEGDKGTMLSIEDGDYPNFIPSYQTTAGICLGSGVAPSKIKNVLGVVKCYTSRTGDLFLPSEIREPKTIAHFYNNGVESEVSDKNNRKVGWLDAVVIKNAIRTNGIKYVALTFLDALSNLEKVKVAISYNLNGKKLNYIPADIKDFEKVIPNYIELPAWKESLKDITKFSQLPKNAKLFVKEIEKILNVKVALISYGKEIKQTLVLKNLFR